MANLYEINHLIEQILDSDLQANDELVNSETGEILNAGELVDQLELDMQTKIDNIACYIKNLNSDIDALKAEEKALAERRKHKENKVESLKKYLSSSLQYAGYNKFETPRCALSFRKSSSVEIAAGTELSEEYMNVKITEEPNKKALMDALKNGISIDGVSIVEKQNIQIK